MVPDAHNPEAGVISIDDMRRAVARIEAMPIDLSEERIDGKKEPIWRELMKHAAKEGATRRSLTYEWMGYDVSIFVSEIRHRAFIYGNEISKPVGKMFLIKMTGEQGALLMGEIPSLTGHVSTFACKANNKEFVDVLRIFLRSITE